VTDGRTRIPRALAAAALCIPAATGSVLLAPAAQAAPDIDTVHERADRLDRRADKASERYDDARLDMTRARTRVRSLASGPRPPRDSAALGRHAAATAELGGGHPHVDTIWQLRVLRMHTLQAAARHRVVVLHRRADRLAAVEARAEAKATRAQRLLETLQERAEARASRSADRTAVPASGRAAAAVRYAMAQVGKSYVYGAAGPSAFDCSGLTMMAWAQAGVGLPHSSSAQMGSGTPVSQSALQPGDLVFYYSPVSHVGMYIGNGQIVNALNPGSGIQVSAVNAMPYAGAVRPG
jgi:cell wall-associated NlpC family hydrolase